MKIWRRKEFLFCFIIIWTAALFQGYALYQEKKEEDKTVEAFETLHLSSVEGLVEISAPIGNDQYVNVTCELKDDVKQLLQYKTKIERLMRMSHLSSFTNLSLKGSRAGKMTLEEKEEVTDRLFHSLEASVVEAVREEELYTVYGYSELLRNSISYGENEINLNLAFTYDEEEDRTVFYLAMPYVQMDY